MCSSGTGTEETKSQPASKQALAAISLGLSSLNGIRNCEAAALARGGGR